MAAKIKKFENVDPQALAAYMKMIEGVDGVEAKGAAAPYTSINGNMYSAVSKDSAIGLRLSKADMAEFMEKYEAELFEPFPGFIQKTYVAVPEALLGNTRILRSWFRKCHDYAATLKPRATTK
jgi:hypothetical protein